MESDWENRAWESLERRLRQDRVFVDRTSTGPARRTPVVGGLVLGATLYVLIPIVMLLSGWPGVAVTLGLTIATVTFVRCGRLYRGRSARPPGRVACGRVTRARIGRRWR